MTACGSRFGVASALFLLLSLFLVDPTGSGSPRAGQASVAPDPATKAPLASRVGDRNSRDPGTPIGAMKAYLHACRRSDWKTAAERLDFSSLAATTDAVEREDLARQLKVILDRTVPIQYELLSSDHDGNTQDGLPPNLERLGTVGSTEILLERSERTDGNEATWRFAASTVAAIPNLYSKHGYGLLGRFLPAPMFEIVWLDLALWQWLGLLLILVLAYPLAWIGTRLLYGTARGVLTRTKSPLQTDQLEPLVAPIRGLLAVGLFALGTVPLALSLVTNGILRVLEIAAAVVLATLLMLRFLDLGSSLMERRWQVEGDRTAVAVLPLGRRALKLFLLCLGLIALLQNIGVNVTGLVAGLGVGGLAVALAAQKTIANLFGGVSMVADQPVQVGDFCRYGDNKTGTVEEIGLRSTRIRTLDRTLVTVPNADFSELHLENYGKRDSMRFYAIIGLRYETSSDQLRYLLTAIRKLLVAHPMIEEEAARARFVAFGAHSLDVEISAYILTDEWSVFLGIREDILMRLMDLVQESGTGFAFPSQTLYLGRDSGLDEERTGKAEERVHRWRERNELPFPNLSEDTIARLNDTADYPPAGSSSAAAAKRDKTEPPS